MSTTNYAGFWLRFVAVIIDGIILGVAFSFIVTPILGLLGLGAAGAVSGQDFGEEDAFALISLIAGAGLAIQGINLVVGWLYFALMESSSRQATIGKMALGLRVTDESGAKLDFLKASIRYFGKLLSAAIFMIGYIMAGFTGKKQALHDIIAKAVVVKK